VAVANEIGVPHHRILALLRQVFVLYSCKYHHEKQLTFVRKSAVFIQLIQPAAFACSRVRQLHPVSGCRGMEGVAYVICRDLSAASAKLHVRFETCPNRAGSIDLSFDVRVALGV